MRKAAKSSVKSPCSNIPLRCPLCHQADPAVWKYNLRAHLIHVHQCKDVSIYEQLYAITDDEIVLMKGSYLSKPRRSRAKKSVKVIAVSEAHSTRVSLR
jgi:hypothetical protein